MTGKLYLSIQKFKQLVVDAPFSFLVLVTKYNRSFSDVQEALSHTHKKYIEHMGFSLFPPKPNFLKVEALLQKVVGYEDIPKPIKVCSSISI